MLCKMKLDLHKAYDSFIGNLINLLETLMFPRKSVTKNIACVTLAFLPLQKWKMPWIFQGKRHRQAPLIIVLIIEYPQSLVLKRARRTEGNRVPKREAHGTRQNALLRKKILKVFHIHKAYFA